MKDLGPVNQILGCQVKQTFAIITAEQSYFIKDMVHKYEKYLIQGT